jgi:RNA polymerase sigma-70 factor (ECF subfamily)
MPDHVSDATLIERFVRGREEAAFAALVQRHGPRVEGICRQLLHDEHDVEDISQATFFVLARKAAALSWQQSVGGWLCSVARRLALGARSDRWRQQQVRTAFASLSDTCVWNRFDASPRRQGEFMHPAGDAFLEIERRDLSRVLHEEVSLLPVKYREPVRLCDLEGLTHKEAARQLRWPAGTMSRRLDRARALLRRRLIRRGVSLVVGFIALTCAVFGVWSSSHTSPSSVVTIRRAMAPLRPLSEAGPGFPNLLSRIDQTQAAPDYDQVFRLARQATRVATDIEKLGPAINQDRWQAYTREMRVWSGLLARATNEKDRPTMMLAARQLNGSCVNCHELFAPESVKAGVIGIDAYLGAESVRHRRGGS